MMGRQDRDQGRLFYEFKAKTQSGWMVLEAYPVSHGKASAYLGLIDLLSNYFKISQQDDDEPDRTAEASATVLMGSCRFIPETFDPYD